MDAIKAKLKDIERIKKYLAEHSLLDRRYAMDKDESYGYLAVKSLGAKEKEGILKLGASIADREMKEVKPLQDYRAILKGRIPENLLDVLPSSFDTVGNVAIFDFKPELLNYEKEIGAAVLKANRSITTVLKKSGIHSGEFRTQKLEYVAGISTKEATYRENNVVLKLDVEEVYFSPRLSTERKRIYQQVKPGENVLVMFSGCGPYPIVLSKNTEAKRIVAIEKNPIAHKYALLNEKLNRAGNVLFINGDVRDVVPKLMPKIGLKSNISKKNILNRLRHNPELFEFYLAPNDLEEKMDEVADAIRFVKEKNIPVYLHMPHFYKGMPIRFDNEYIDNTIEMISLLEGLYVKEGLFGYIVHPAMPQVPGQMEVFLKNFEKLRTKINGILDHAYFENLIYDFFNTTESINSVIKKTGMKHICFDIAHAYNVYGSTVKINEMIASINANKHFHITDSRKILRGGEESVPIGKGEIDWQAIVPVLGSGIIEVCNTDEETGEESIESYYMYRGMLRFDRILMPLPKGAENFLDTALSAAKKGSVIHFYDFEHENETVNAIEKVKAACKRLNVKCRILDLLKCGQYSPGKYRVCVDFIVD